MGAVKHNGETKMFEQAMIDEVRIIREAIESIARSQTSDSDTEYIVGRIAEVRDGIRSLDGSLSGVMDSIDGVAKSIDLAAGTDATVSNLIRDNNDDEDV